jgi:hypothetical protein
MATGMEMSARSLRARVRAELYAALRVSAALPWLWRNREHLSARA